MPEKGTAIPKQCIRVGSCFMTVRELIDKLNGTENKDAEVYCEADDYPYGSGYYEVKRVKPSDDKERVYLKVFIDD